MQITWLCMQCGFEGDGSHRTTFYSVDVPENGLIEGTCNQGHRSCTVIQESKFEILSLMGVNAINNGSYRDAVFSLSACLERLYELFIEAACRRQGVSAAAFAETWKSMANQTERQLGAFLATFMLETGEAPMIMPRKQVELRNSVAHKGSFPTREEATNFGKAVFDCATPILEVLRANSFAEIIGTLTFERIRSRSKQVSDAGLRVSTMSISTPLSLTTVPLATDIEPLVAAYKHRPF